MTTRYTVTFVNWDGTVLSAAQYVEGTAASDITVPADPTRPSDDSFRYIFVGWTPALAAVTADATYTATYVAEELSYFDVTFVDYDGTVLQATTSYADGTAVSDIAVPAEPTRAATTTHAYTFAGWDPPLGPVTADVTYTATYTETPVTYGAPSIELDHDLDYWEDA
ncbi:MAG: InlB B-repeat-containing protein, partial [Atopobiaceae bacterium]|nr:InlB B-repeat-containing protein [Atopobiaceae bacterium]